LKRKRDGAGDAVLFPINENHSFSSIGSEKTFRYAKPDSFTLSGFNFRIYGAFPFRMIDFFTPVCYNFIQSISLK